MAKKLIAMLSQLKKVNLKSCNQKTADNSSKIRALCTAVRPPQCPDQISIFPLARIEYFRKLDRRFLPLFPRSAWEHSSDAPRPK